MSHFVIRNYNQGTNGLVNAHPTSGHGISTISDFNQFLPCRKIGQSQPRVIIYVNSGELESPMVDAKF